MCGIFGFYLNRRLNEKDLLLGKSGMKALRHRGPDYSNYWTSIENGIFLGHTRLSIIDLSEQSNQPMIRDNAVLAYNGEIYNYVELKKELVNQGFAFTSSGDAEVLLNSWHRWKTDALNHFDGMFAFALYQDKQLHLATDPFGEKPLYWTRTKEGIYFSSEPNPLVKLLSIKPNFSLEDITSFLCLGFLPDSSSGYSNLHRMPPGSHFICSPNKNIEERKYWSPSKLNTCKEKTQELSEKNLDDISHALIESLRVRLRSDVPLGFFLSSGVDSSLITALAVKELNHKPLALTVSFPDKEVNDESDAAEGIAKFLGLNHKKINSLDDPARAKPSLIFDLFGEANDNLTVAAFYQMSKVARSLIKVAVTGMGGDELFYGYSKYQTLYQWRHLLSLPQSVRKSLSLLLPDRILGGRFSYLSQVLSSSDTSQFIAVKNPACCRWLWKLPQVENVSRKLFSGLNFPLDIKGRYFDLINTMPYTFIPAVERGSMRASLEVRTPFLNRRLFEIISNLDQRSFVSFGQKSILRRILKRYLPEKLFNYPKRGFNYPTGYFLKEYERTIPKIEGLPEKNTELAWKQRNQKGWQKLALRLAILNHYQNHG